MTMGATLPTRTLQWKLSVLPCSWKILTAIKLLNEFEQEASILRLTGILLVRWTVMTRTFLASCDLYPHRNHLSVLLGNG